MKKQLHGIIRGEVQGVSFRDFTRSAARAALLTGFVRNLSDGAVEVVAEGEESDLRAFLLHLKEKHPFAKVERIDEVWREPTGEFSGFHIR